MNQDYKNCLDKGKIFAESAAKELAVKELATASTDLEEARDRFTHDRYKYCTITAYYAMFHAARALLYSRGYKERSHRCLVAALEFFFVKNNLLEMRFIRGLLKAMSLREDADYADEYSQKGAQDVLTGAQEFIQKAQEILIIKV